MTYHQKENIAIWTISASNSVGGLCAERSPPGCELLAGKGGCTSLNNLLLNGLAGEAGIAVNKNFKHDGLCKKRTYCIIEKNLKASLVAES